MDKVKAKFANLKKSHQEDKDKWKAKSSNYKAQLEKNRGNLEEVRMRASNLEGQLQVYQATAKKD